MLALRLALLVLLAPPATAAADWVPLEGARGEPRTTVVATDDTGITLSVHFPGLDVETVDTPAGPFTRISAPGCGVTTDSGAPLLPTLRAHVAIPQDATPTIEVIDVQVVDLTLAELGDGHTILPAQPPLPKVPGARENVTFVLREDAYASAQLTPSDPVRLGDVGQVRGHRFVELEVSPVQIAPATGQVRLTTAATVRIEFVGADWTRTAQVLARYSAPGFDTFADREFVTHPDLTSKATLPLPIGYVIIAHDDFLEEIQPLAELKHLLGYEVTLVALSDVTANNNPQDLRDYLTDAYATWETPPTFVLLVGDTDQIAPFQGGYAQAVTDLYYSALEGGNDWLPDVYIGRFSCETEDEVTLLTDKTVRYTLFDLKVGTDWIRRATFMASDDNHQVSESTHDYCIDTWLDPDGYTTTRRYSHDGATASQVIADVEAGLSQLTYSGHGDTNLWADGPVMDAGDVHGIDNGDMLPVVQSYACLTGEFDRDCFAETWTLADTGAVAFWGSSTYSYWDEDDILERAVYDAWYGVDPHTWLRGALNEGLWAVYDHYSGSGETHAYYEQYNLFGDPSLDTWTAAPGELFVTYAPTVAVEVEDFVVDVLNADGEPQENALVCLHLADQIYETAYTDASGHAELAVDPLPDGPGTADVHVSKHNYIPFSGTVEVDAEVVGDDDDDDDDSSSAADDDDDVEPGDDDDDDDDDVEPGDDDDDDSDSVTVPEAGPAEVTLGSACNCRQVGDGSPAPTLLGLLAALALAARRR